MTRSLRTIAAACYGPAWRLAAAAGTFYVGQHDGPAPLGLSELWYFATAYLALWAINIAVPVRLVRNVTELLMKVTLALTYGYAAVKMDFWPATIAAGLVIGVLAADLWFDQGPSRLFDRLAAHLFTRTPMPADDARFWAECKTVRDFGRVNALYLRGLIGSQLACTYSTGLDSETSDLVPVLSAASLAGFYTTGSQPERDGDHEQNAYVVGFADTATMRRLHSLLADSGLHFRIRHTSSRRDYTNYGQISWGVLSPGDIDSYYDTVCDAEGVSALLDAYQIVIEDPEAGRADELWWRLALFAYQRGYLVGDDEPSDNPFDHVQLYTRSHALLGADVRTGMWLDQANHTGARRIEMIRGATPGTFTAFLPGMDPAEAVTLEADREYIVVNPTSAIQPAKSKSNA